MHQPCSPVLPAARPPARRPVRFGAAPGRAAIRSALAGLAIAIGLAAPAARAQEAVGAGLPYYEEGAAKNLTLLGIPSATVAPHGLGFASLGLTSKRGGVLNEWDGSLALGLGLGDAERALGFQLTANLTSLTNAFGDSGYFEAKVSRLVSSGDTPLYLGAQVEGLAKWGQASTVPTRGRIMATWFPDLSAGGDLFPLMVTVGYGTHLRNARTDPGVFGGVGIGVNRNLGLSAAWTGETLDLGASWKFDDIDWMTVSAEINDATDRLGQRRVSITVNLFNPKLFRS
ncbi:hypothetical protein [Antarcticimicrobium luteum]|uniref:Uncharacterized protein n=1 Tax=Antarcticimicrobium luteum TaxID=2547397 RepID=A0A4R5V5M9_9RHOB|nr:hypothetical protein [Antarcticimicrobium luteum]TDK46855.1 hypothetical protein E1832_12215 [Antarcticimicrobium luteum]